MATKFKRKALAGKDLLTWKNIGGSHRIKHPDPKKRIIKTGQIFQAREIDIPDSFRDKIICLDETALARENAKKAEKIKEKAKEPEALYELQEVENESGESGDEVQYNVISVENGKALNDEPMIKEDAEELLKSANS